MKRIVFSGFVLVLALMALILPIVAQDTTATEEPTEEAVAYDPEACFRAAPNNDTTVSFPAKEGPYTIGISNSFIGNAWRTQMIQMAQAWAATPEVKPMIKELIVVSTGEDVEAQIAAMDNMIALGVDAIILNAA